MRALVTRGSSTKIQGRFSHISSRRGYREFTLGSGGLHRHSAGRGEFKNVAEAAKTQIDFASLRRSGGPEALAAETVKWLAALPKEVRPKLLPIQFARIANGLARKWTDIAGCLTYFDDLLIDRRGNRRGFPIGIVIELAALKNYFESVLHRAPQTVWEEVAHRLRG